ncbi:helix-turn-helix domain-containing protein [Flavobacterium hercynium]|uniref:Transcriptional regulator n=1 Tax=Flavobacterium hercynium TaxID=387094 RepID=A0A226HMQ3_9FLAO|nr:helix-turn-helix transcriptional regulator [Flavobacterium hercynium]OXA95609.1 transcriptional regulator [Flavobacterium hercynium]SMP22210.1 Helix-turn-helix [Flavobacterium hercynium]
MENSLAEIEKYIIQRVRVIRKERGLTQEQLSLKLDKGVGFIGDIESPSKKAKYNVKHLNEIAKIFECSPKDFWPEKPL